MGRTSRLSDLIVGEPDANVEQYVAKRQGEEANFIKYYYSIPNFSIESFLRGEKTFLLGQKGTGKTAILRNIYTQAKSKGMSCEFIVFKSTILEEAELLNLHGLPVIYDKELTRVKHYFHVLKRIILLIIASKLVLPAADVDSADVIEEDKGLLRKIVGSNIVDVIKLGFDSVFDILNSAKLDIKAATGGIVSSLDEGRFIKKSNDSLTRFILRSAQSEGAKFRIFFDEVHFAYRSDESLTGDAMLVRERLKNLPHSA